MSTIRGNHSRLSRIVKTAKLDRPPERFEHSVRQVIVAAYASHLGATDAEAWEKAGAPEELVPEGSTSTVDQIVAATLAKS